MKKTNFDEDTKFAYKIMIIVRGISYLFASAFFIIFIALFCKHFSLLWCYISNPEAIVDSTKEFDLLRDIFAIFGGFLGIIALTFAYERSEQTERGLEQTRTSLKQAKENQYESMYSNAITSLDKNSTHSAVGALYTLSDIYKNVDDNFKGRIYVTVLSFFEELLNRNKDVKDVVHKLRNILLANIHKNFDSELENGIIINIKSGTINKLESYREHIERYDIRHESTESILKEIEILITAILSSNIYKSIDSDAIKMEILLATQNLLEFILRFNPQIFLNYHTKFSEFKAIIDNHIENNLTEYRR